MKHETILSNARIVGREEIPRGSVLIRDGLIADISSSILFSGILSLPRM